MAEPTTREPTDAPEVESSMVTITVNGQTLTVPQGRSLLGACLDHGIYIPNLCHIPGLEPPQASCRLCWVEIEGRPEPVPACTLEVSAGLKVQTETARVRELQRSGLRLLLSVHEIACKTCPANRRCPLQKMARYLESPLKPEPLASYPKTPAVDSSHPAIDYFQNRCVLCGQCVHACRAGTESPRLAFAQRGFDTVIRYFSLNPETDSDCQSCQTCVTACPVAALQLRTSA